jgi:hypothetical protein
MPLPKQCGQSGEIESATKSDASAVSTAADRSELLLLRFSELFMKEIRAADYNN